MVNQLMLALCNCLYILRAPHGLGAQRTYTSTKSFLIYIRAHAAAFSEEDALGQGAWDVLGYV